MPTVRPSHGPTMRTSPWLPWLCPRRIRPYVAAVYAFARTADDFADEGERTPEERLALLDAWEGMLHKAYEGDATASDLHRDHGNSGRDRHSETAAARPSACIPDGCDRQTVPDVRGCARLLPVFCESGRPAGAPSVRRSPGPETTAPSDAICTGLQLANFYQDYSVDLTRGRLYVPLDEMTRFGYTEVQIPGCGAGWPVP